MIPPLIHQIWIGGTALPLRYDKWHRMLNFINPRWGIILWDDEKLVNDGINLTSLYSKYWSHASVSNMVRLLLVQKYGGIYLDMDMEPLRGLDCLRQVYGNAVACDQGDGRICNAFFGAPPDHPWVNWQVDHGNGECDPHDAAWGVYTMTKAPRDDLHLAPTELVYPFHYSVPTAERKPSEHSVLVHHWDGSWTK